MWEDWNNFHLQYMLYNKYCRNTSVSLFFVLFKSLLGFHISPIHHIKVSYHVINLHNTYKVVIVIADAILQCCRMFWYAAWPTTSVLQHLPKLLFPSINLSVSLCIFYCRVWPFPRWSRPIHLCGKLHFNFIAGGVYVLLSDLAILLHDMVCSVVVCPVFCCHQSTSSIL